VGLLRVSSPGQVTDGDGLETQRDAIRRWVRQRGDKLVTVLADEGIPGTMKHLSERIALGEALQMVKDGRADGIVVYKLDRIGRETMLQESVYYEIQQNEGTLASCDEGENDALEAGDDDPTRVLFRKILWAFAEYERKMIRVRCVNGRRRKMAAGGYGGGSTPYGFKAEGGLLVEDANEMSAIGQALTMREMGVPYRVIGEFFAGHGMRLRKGSSWHPSTIKVVLDRALLSGTPRPAKLTNLARKYLDMPLPEQAV
jgi:DNA invertase Pin-like site-specific DNA recombinase